MKSELRKLLMSSRLLKKPMSETFSNKKKSPTGESLRNRTKRVKQALEIDMRDRGVEEMPEISFEKVTILHGDLKEQVYLYRFGESIQSPLDGKIKYISKRACARDKEFILSKLVCGQERAADYLRLVYSLEVPAVEEVVVHYGWQKGLLDDFFRSLEKYMRETRYPDENGVMVPTYALSKETRVYLRTNFMKVNLEGDFVILGGVPLKI